MGVRFPSPAPVDESMGYGLQFFRIIIKIAIFATKCRSSGTRRNPPLSESVRLGLWRVCGESLATKPCTPTITSSIVLERQPGADTGGSLSSIFSTSALPYREANGSYLRPTPPLRAESSRARRPPQQSEDGGAQSATARLQCPSHRAVVRTSRPRRTKHIGVLRTTRHDPNGGQHSLPIGGERVNGSLDALGAHQELF